MFNEPPEKQAVAASDLNHWLRSGAIRAQIDRVLKLSEARFAHELQESNTIHKSGALAGKLVLVPYPHSNDKTNVSSFPFRFPIRRFAMTRNSLNEARTKIVATVGPACEDEATLAEMIQHGVDVFRINAAHGTQADYERMRSQIVRAGEIAGFHVGILLDLAGPKIRLGKLFNDQPHDVEIGDQ